MRFYRIKRFYEDGRRPRIIRKGLTLEEAKKHCNDPETSSETASAPRGCAGNEAKIKQWHERKKHWFDGFEEA